MQSKPENKQIAILESTANVAKIYLEQTDTITSETLISRILPQKQVKLQDNRPKTLELHYTSDANRRIATCSRFCRKIEKAKCDQTLCLTPPGFSTTTCTGKCNNCIHLASHRSQGIQRKRISAQLQIHKNLRTQPRINRFRFRELDAPDTYEEISVGFHKETRRNKPYTIKR